MNSFDFIKLSMAMAIKVPFLEDDLSKSSIISFLRSYEQYSLQCSSMGSSPLAIQSCLLPDQLLFIAEINGLDVYNMVSTKYSLSEFSKLLSTIHLISNSILASKVLKNLCLHSVDFSLTDLINYNRLFDFEVMCIGTCLSKKRVVQLYINSLHPQSLADSVRCMSPSSYDEAKLFARSAMSSLRASSQLFFFYL